METSIVEIGKTIGFGMLTGFFAGYVIRKGLIFIVFTFLLSAFVLHFLGLIDNLLSVWSTFGDFALSFLRNAGQDIWAKLEVNMPDKTWSIGLFAGLTLSFLRK